MNEWILLTELAFGKRDELLLFRLQLVRTWHSRLCSALVLFKEKSSLSLYSATWCLFCVMALQLSALAVVSIDPLNDTFDTNTTVCVCAHVWERDRQPGLFPLDVRGFKVQPRLICSVQLCHYSQASGWPHVWKIYRNDLFAITAGDSLLVAFSIEGEWGF